MMEWSSRRLADTSCSSNQLREHLLRAGLARARAAEILDPAMQLASLLRKRTLLIEQLLK